MTFIIEDYKAIKKVKMNNTSDLTLRTSIENIENNFITMGRVLFEHKFPGTLDPVVLSGNYGNKEVSFTFSQLKGVVGLLHNELNELGIHKGVSIMLVPFPTSSELLKSIYLITLVSMGARVFMPRKCSKEELMDWITKTNLQYAIIPGKELLSQEQHEEDNAALLELNDVFISRHVSILDTISSFPLEKIIVSGEYTSMTGNGGRCQAYLEVQPGEEALILTFPGTNGNTILKSYTQLEIVQQAVPLKLPISILFRLMEEGVQ
jgi:hypothetical protein